MFHVKTKARNADDNPFTADEDSKSTVLQYSRASLVYSFVPYLGIVFSPFAVGLAVAAIVRSGPIDEASERPIAARYIAGSVVVALAQIGLWWLFYIIPDLSR